jgi:hypothetical protein
MNAEVKLAPALSSIFDIQNSMFDIHFLVFVLLRVWSEFVHQVGVVHPHCEEWGCWRPAFG